ncbi:allene oxide synthase-lipoxygenase protein-like [Ostrea edulis]|uniref:allene oxide synthase-lipoxygenase protein-like n=1 Tax=Ostrea edulis TaxID=37623 RepID=UPI0024AF8588|nr:allene oxide synthase-lipoxygenase protein-like [Ostrea edulis]
MMNRFQDIDGKPHPYLDQSGSDKKLFFEVDLAEISEDSENLCMSPLTVLFVVYSELLMPVAICDHHRNRVSIPATDAHERREIERWTKEKMKFDMMDAQYHESITHLGFTHMLMDGVSVCARRNLSDRHPLLILLAPHFRYMHQINYLATVRLLNKNGYVDQDMLISRKEMLMAVAKHNRTWRLDHHGSFKKDLRTRGVENLPGYYFRDDAMKVHEAIQDFVDEYVKLYYGCNDDVSKDYELQDFRTELTKQRNLNGTGGCGMQGVPEFENIENVVTTLTSFIFICSVEHSAANFPQFDHYGYPPNHPAILDMAEHKDVEEGIDVLMPTTKQFFSTLSIMKILTMVMTNKLGTYEKEYWDAMDRSAKGIIES